jgi:RND family efflux transporter MFP subunit
MSELNEKKLSRSKINVLVRIALVTAILFIGLSVMTKLASLKKPPAEAKIEEKPLRVEIVQVTPEQVPVFLSGYGEAKALTVVSIASEVSGRVIDIHPRLKTGEQVEKNEILFRIDSRDYAASYADAQATVRQLKHSISILEKQYATDKVRLKTLQRNETLAKEEYGRVKKLFEESDIGTRSGVDLAEQAFNNASDQVDQMESAVSLYPIRIEEARSGLVSAEARLSITSNNLKRCAVRAPFDGRIKNVMIEKDQFISPGQGVLTLADDSILEIQVPLDSRDARQWLFFDGDHQNNDSAWFARLKPVECDIKWTENPEGEAWKGILHRVVAFDQKTRTVTVAVRIDGKRASTGNTETLPLVEGMFCSVKIPGRIMPHVFALPRWAVSFENTVYVMSEENRLKTVSVEVAHTEGDTVFVSKGLQPGDKVITTRLIDPLENALLQVIQS